MTLRTRLTAVYTALLAAVLAITALVYARAQIHVMREHFDQRLLSAEGVVDYAVRDRRTDAGTEVAARSLLLQLRFPDVAVAIGVLPGAAPPLIFAGSDTRLARLLPSDACRPQGVAPIDLGGEAMHVLVHCIEAQGDEPALAAVIGASEAPLIAQQRQLLTVLAAIIALALMLAAAVGHWLSGRTLAPIRTMTAAVQQIGAEQLDQRLPVRASDGEIAELSRMINDLFDRLATVVARERRFLANAAHALRTPVAVLRAEVSEALEHAPPAGETRQALDEITQSVAHLGRTVEYLLSLARRDSGGEVPPVTRLYLDDVASGTAARMSRVFGDRGVGLRWGRLEETPVLANTDVADQVLQILLENAAQYCPPGSTVVVSVHPTPGGGAMIVEDDGPGLTEEDRSILFVPFVRGTAAQRTAARGSGLGLAVAEWLVRSVDGEITAATRPEGGTRFVVRFAAA